LCLCPDQLDLFNSLIFCDFFFSCASEILRLDEAGWEWLANVEALSGQRTVSSITVNEFVMSTLLYDNAIRHDSNIISIADSGEFVGNDNRRTILGHAVKRLLNDLLCFGVQSASCFVKE
jgi:hypothetical protein